MGQGALWWSKSDQPELHGSEAGLLYYHARYYDPSLARFVSPDSIVPGISSLAGGAGGLITLGEHQNSRLTVDLHEVSLQKSVKRENALVLQKGFWFQLGSDDMQRAGDPSGPRDPQTLNRYSYVLNNPVKYTDPTGHYDYTYNWFIGRVRDGVTDVAVMNELKSHPQKYFPFRVTPVGGCATIMRGCLFELDPGIPLSNPYIVRVTDVTDTSFAFEVIVCNSCFAEVGSKITFKTYETKGETGTTPI